MRTFVVLASAFISVASAARADDSLKPIDVALGEWRPFVSESIEGYGEVAERVTAVLERMGYRPNYIFMPWGQAEKAVRENETNLGPRITFPYLSTTKRRREFQFSDHPVHETCMKFFYNRRKFKDPERPSIAKVEDLADFGVAYVKEDAGYQYPDKEPGNLAGVLKGLKTAGKAVALDSLYDAFHRLVDEADKKIQVVPAAERVGEEILVDLFPKKRFDIGQIEERIGDARRQVEDGRDVARDEDNCLLHVKYYLMLSRRNADNEEFKKRFDDAFKNLDHEKAARIDLRAEERPSVRRPEVVLHADGAAAAIPGWDAKGEVYALPRGTRGLLRQWTSGSGASLPEASAEVFITNGPYRGKKLWIDGRHIELQ